MPTDSFQDRYGPWALVAGASEGIGEQFARRLAERGLALLLIARRGEVLDTLAADLRSEYGVEVRTLAADLGAPDATERIVAASEGLEVGLLVYNAAVSRIGSFLERPLDAAAMSAVADASLYRQRA